MFWFAAAHRHPRLCISANRPAILSQIPAINQTLYFHGRIYPLPLSLANPPTLRISQSQGLRATSNKNGDMDDEMDDLINKYGEVVYRSKDQKPHAAEVDDDAESLSLAVTLAKVANEIDAIGTRIRDIAEKQFKRVARGDTKPNSWTLLDFGDVVVHIFLPQQREFYNLEEFYGNATLIELPFNTESTSFRE